MRYQDTRLKRILLVIYAPRKVEASFCHLSLSPLIPPTDGSYPFSSLCAYCASLHLHESAQLLRRYASCDCIMHGVPLFPINAAGSRPISYNKSLSLTTRLASASRTKKNGYLKGDRKK